MPSGNANDVDTDALVIYQGLDPIERQVLACYVAGHSNDIIIDRFGFCEITAEAYRASLMRKMRASNLVELLVRARICNLAASAGTTAMGR
jgi:FixJ family two-component response regulator